MAASSPLSEEAHFCAVHQRFESSKMEDGDILGDGADSG